MGGGACVFVEQRFVIQGFHLIINLKFVSYFYNY